MVGDDLAVLQNYMVFTSHSGLGMNVMSHTVQCQFSLDPFHTGPRNKIERTGFHEFLVRCNIMVVIRLVIWPGPGVV